MIDYLMPLQDFHFIRPYWLFAIVPLMLVVWLIKYVKQQQSGWQAVLANHLYKQLITTQNSGQSRPPLYLLAFGWIIACIAMAGPTWQKLPQPVYQLNVGKVVLLDMSMSMRATDLAPDRLTRAKYKTIDLVNELTEGETGLVAYAGDAFTISPLTSDVQNLTTLIPSLTPEIMPIPGSDPALGLEAAISLLDNAGYQKGDIFWVTDGVSNQQMKELSEIINKSAYRISILAVGTEEGAPIKMLNGELKKDNTGAIVIPKLTSSNLSSLTRISGGRFAPIQNDDSDIEFLVKQQLTELESPQESTESQDKFGDKWQEMGPYLVLLLLPFAAYAFRRGVLSLLLVAGLLPLYTPNAQANWWQDMWKTSDQQAMQAYKQQEFEQAANTFDDPMWQGNAHYRNENYQQAIEAYADIDSPQAKYNMGNAFAQLGEIDKAIAAYEQVLQAQPDHDDAKANKALLEALKKQQEEQNNQDGENQQSDEQDNQQQSDQQQQNSDQQGEQSEQQPSDSQESQQDQQPNSSNQQQPSEPNDESQSENTEDPQQDSPNPENSPEPKNSPEHENSPESKNSPKAEDSEQQEEAEKMPPPALAQGEEAPLTDEQKEQMQRMQTLLNKVPDDPAFLLKRKMQIEAQRRQRDRLPNSVQEDW